MSEVAYFERAEQWGGQAKTWVRLHDPSCYIYADYCGVSIAGDWHTVSIEEKRELVTVFEEARRYHLERVRQVNKPPRPEQEQQDRDSPPDGLAVWTGERWSY